MTKKEMQCARHLLWSTFNDQTSSVLSPFPYLPYIFNESFLYIQVFSLPSRWSYIDYIVCASEYLWGSFLNLSLCDSRTFIMLWMLICVCVCYMFQISRWRCSWIVISTSRKVQWRGLCSWIPSSPCSRGVWGCAMANACATTQRST